MQGRSVNPLSFHSNVVVSPIHKHLRIVPSGMPTEEKRFENRLAASGDGTILVRDVEIPVTLVDVSTGGCKLRLAPEVDALFAKLIPMDIRLVLFEVEYDAIAQWNTNGLLGCRFKRHLELKEVAELMASKARSNRARA